MATFKDAEGRLWEVDLNVAVLKRVRSILDVDLTRLLEEDEAEATLLERLCTDPVLLVDVLYVVCREQAKAEGVSDEQFGCAMASDVISDAADALMDAIVVFTPDPRQRARLKRVREALTALEEKANEALDTQMEKALSSGMLSDFVEETLGILLPNSPESAESVQTPGPSQNSAGPPGGG